MIKDSRTDVDKVVWAELGVECCGEGEERGVLCYNHGDDCGGLW